MAYKRELIVNDGNHLPSYKKLLKVSDVCQLLDKREYQKPPTLTGLSIINNNNGTILFNGTYTGTDVGWYWLYPASIANKFPVKVGHVYLVSDVSSVAPNFSIQFRGAQAFLSAVANRIFTLTFTPNDIRFLYGFDNGDTFTNSLSKPQLFDLTEMYGAGNEPKTVEEFRADFPDELYDYSPRCWVKSYKTQLVVNDGKTI